jgi:hypothetical protein
MSEQTTLEATRNATSSPASGDGATRSGLQECQMTDLFGQDLAPASHSAKRGISVAAQMSATYGLRSSASSASAALQRSLANRLPALLDSHGGTMWRLTWRAKATPQRRRICQLAALVQRTPGHVCTGWLPTPRASMGKHMVCWSRAASGEHRSQLEDYLAWLYMADGGNRMGGANVDPLLCATMMGFPPFWLASATPSCPSLEPAL